MRFEEPSFDSREGTELLLRTGDAYTVCTAIIGAALVSSDGGWVESAAVDLTAHPDPDVRRASILALGHLGRRFRVFNEPDAVATAITRLQQDPLVGGTVQDVVDDLQRFIVQPENDSRL